MKKSIRTLLTGAVAALALACVNVSIAAEKTTTQTTTTSTTTSKGMISEFSPDTIVVRSESQPEPLRYSYSKTTTYVDDSGSPVSLETVKSGLPVTVHYAREGDRMIANRVVVHQSKSPTAVEKRTTTTTRTEKKNKDD